MNVIGEIVDVLPVQSGEGKNGAWKKSTYVVESGGQYPKKVAVVVFGDKMPVFKLGDKINFSVDIESKEFNGKWYTEVKAFKYDLASSGASKPGDDTKYEEHAGADVFAAGSDSDSNLPF